MYQLSQFASPLLLTVLNLAFSLSLSFSFSLTFAIRTRKTESDTVPFASANQH